MCSCYAATKKIESDEQPVLTCREKKWEYSASEMLLLPHLHLLLLLLLVSESLVFLLGIRRDYF